MPITCRARELRVIDDHSPLIRSAQESDRQQLVRMHDRCGLDSRIGRWLAPLRAIPRPYLDSALAGGAQHLALVAEEPHSEQIIGLASAVRRCDASYEIGLLVEDRHQGRGVGRALLQALLERTARGSTIELVADVSLAQGWIADALRRLGAATVRRSRWSTRVTVIYVGAAGEPPEVGAVHVAPGRRVDLGQLGRR